MLILIAWKVPDTIQEDTGANDDNNGGSSESSDLDGAQNQRHDSIMDLV